MSCNLFLTDLNRSALWWCELPTVFKSFITERQSLVWLLLQKLDVLVAAAMFVLLIHYLAEACAGSQHLSVSWVRCIHAAVFCCLSEISRFLKTWMMSDPGSWNEDMMFTCMHAKKEYLKKNPDHVNKTLSGKGQSPFSFLTTGNGISPPSCLLTVSSTSLSSHRNAVVASFQRTVIIAITLMYLPFPSTWHPISYSAHSHSTLGLPGICVWIGEQGPAITSCYSHSPSLHAFPFLHTAHFTQTLGRPYFYFALRIFRASILNLNGTSVY